MNLIILIILVTIAVTLVRLFKDKLPESYKNISTLITSEVNKKMLERTNCNTSYAEQTRYFNFVQLMADMVKKQSALFPVKIMISDVPDWMPLTGFDGKNVCRLEYLRQNTQSLPLDEGRTAQDEIFRQIQFAIDEYYKRNLYTIRLAIWRITIYDEFLYCDFLLLNSRAEMNQYQAELRQHKFLDMQAEQTTPPPRDSEF